MQKKNPLSSALINLEWARVYAGRIQHELNLIARTLADHNAHIVNLELVRGAILLKTQMKQASQQVSGMSNVATQSEKDWMSRIKKVLQTKYSDERPSKKWRARADSAIQRSLSIPAPDWLHRYPQLSDVSFRLRALPAADKFALKTPKSTAKGRSLDRAGTDDAADQPAPVTRLRVRHTQ
jgi:hypothetical protein